MYFTSLPDHTQPGFDEKAHFSMFGKSNIIFNTQSRFANCDDHVGCLSFKTVFQGEEWYGIKGRQLAVRPGHFLMLNDNQNYSCRIEKGNEVKTFSVFFEKKFARSVYRDVLNDEESLLDDPEGCDAAGPEFFQTLYPLDNILKNSVTHFVHALTQSGYHRMQVDTFLTSFLCKLINHKESQAAASDKINAAKASTRSEIFKRLCIAKDYLHSFYANPIDLESLSNVSCMSIPQLVRNFKAMYNMPPHKYLACLRIERAADFLKNTDWFVNDIASKCGFEDASAFSRAFRLKFGVEPSVYRRTKRS